MTDLNHHYERLKRMYEAAPCNAHVRPTITVSSGAAEVVFAVRPELLHSAGGLHGSYYFKALDDAAFFAANSVVEDVLVLTVSFSVQFLRPISAGTVRAVGSLIRPGRQMLFAASTVFDSEGRQAGLGTGVFARSSVRLAEGIGYA